MAYPKVLTSIILTTREKKRAKRVSRRAKCAVRVRKLTPCDGVQRVFAHPQGFYFKPRNATERWQWQHVMINAVWHGEGKAPWWALENQGPRLHEVLPHPY